MRIPDWTPEARKQPQDLIDAIMDRRGGTMINLDLALLWSEPLARGWNTYLKAVRTGLGASRALREIGICTVALVTGAQYEYHHHAPDYIRAGGSEKTLEALNSYFTSNNALALSDVSDDEKLVINYAIQMTRNVTVEDNLFKQMQARFDTTELVELTAAIATYNMVARFLVALGVSPEH